ncbi:class I SAM-dependent methyltransferase [Cryptosporangium phraense]|uniref:Class I SAM-dependent methyltransferase n=1 Tax=Cryptosporangium phraense TaxID=2593070 RepID=A0A545AKH2_9ACTN|nr:class I SAM-dependent methyltransferase [Cryptosporangium phraense]TQS41814.1 class I SAM-dependent methyltransferase [Cryptosporangium phraense]
MPTDSPFTDKGLVRGALYAAPARLQQRTGALHRAKIEGADATATIVDLAVEAAPHAQCILDIGCGRGTSTVQLANRYPEAHLVAIDQSKALLDVAAERLRSAGHHPDVVVADFHQLRVATGTVDLAVAAFCLYHSSQPDSVLTEIARCLRPDGVIVAVTKSADSYREIDEVMVASGMDPDATRRPSLYQSFHSANAENAIESAGLMVRGRIDECHTFRFSDAEHLAEYAGTSPKYQVRTDDLVEALRAEMPEYGLTTFSTVTYLLAARP